MKITESSDMPPIDLVALGKMLGDEPASVSYTHLRAHETP